MFDAIMLILIVASFVLAGAYARLCERLLAPAGDTDMTP
jgi:hypothetical protein